MLYPCKMCKNMIQVKSVSPKDIDKKLVSITRQVKKRRDGEIISETELDMRICLSCVETIKESGWATKPDGTLELVDGTTIEKGGVSYMCENGKWVALDE